MRILIETQEFEIWQAQKRKRKSLINWGNFKGDRNLGLRDGLLALQKRLVGIVCGTHRISHADPLFAGIGALKVDDLYVKRNGSF